MKLNADQSATRINSNKGREQNFLEKLQPRANKPVTDEKVLAAQSV
jgi:hypothetical protein